MSDCLGRWARALQRWIYEPLTFDNGAEPADLIFVLAGRMERKSYALDLYRAGYAPRLLLSVGRFEVSRMRALGLECSAELEALRDKVPPDERHFFIQMDSSGTRIELARLSPWNTYGEAVALKQYLQRQSASSVLAVSTAFHLRRVAWTFRHVFRAMPIHFHYCAVPEDRDSIQSRTWWTYRTARYLVLSEYLKLAGYGLLLWAPGWAVRRAMNWKLVRFVGSHPR